MSCHLHVCGANRAWIQSRVGRLGNASTPVKKPGKAQECPNTSDVQPCLKVAVELEGQIGHFENLRQGLVPYLLFGFGFWFCFDFGWVGWFGCWFFFFPSGMYMIIDVYSDNQLHRQDWKHKLDFHPG